MNTKLIGQKIADIARQAWLFPQTVLATIRWYREANVRAAAEAERLDRIRNPLKYLGK